MKTKPKPFLSCAEERTCVERANRLAQSEGHDATFAGVLLEFLKFRDQKILVAKCRKGFGRRRRK